MSGGRTEPDSHPQDPLRIGVAIVQRLIGDRLAYLVGTRAVDAVEGGKAEFPGGKCEPYESPRETAIRECAEETGLRVEPFRLLETRHHDGPAGPIELHFWLCRETGEPDTDPLPPFRWVDAATLSDLDFPTANRSVVEQLREG